MTVPADMIDELPDDPDPDNEDDINNTSWDEQDAEPENDNDFRGIVADSDLGDFINRPKTAVAREYEKKTAAALNSLFKGLAPNPSTVVDAATILVFGDAFSAAAGELAQEDEHARKFVDFITTPSNPWIAFGMVAIPMAAQFFRNHETAIEEMPPVKKVIGVKIPFTKRAISIPLRIKLRLPGKLRAQTTRPEALLNVFEHPKVIKALNKRGIEVSKTVKIGKRTFRRA